MSTSAWIVIAIGAALSLIVATAALAVVLARSIARSSEPFKDGVVTTAVVVDHELYATPDGQHTLLPVYRFVDVHGVERTARDHIGDNGSIQVGAVLDISYRPNDPTRVRRIAKR